MVKASEVYDESQFINRHLVSFSDDQLVYSCEEHKRENNKFGK